MLKLIVIFRTHSDVEANVVRGLLESNGIHTLLASDVPHSVFPLSINELGEVRLSVREDDAEKGQLLIESFKKEGTANTVRLRDECKELEFVLGYTFRDYGLLEHALTHRSRAHEDASGGVIDNESLEFLGDAVLGLVIADYLFRHFPDYDEGRKSKARALLVSAPSLAKLGIKLRLGEYLLLGRGEEKTGGRQKPSLLADTFEAVVAAVYLDGGINEAEAFIVRLFRESLDSLRAGVNIDCLNSDNKSKLQEWLQAHDRPLPVYRLADELGPGHCKTFEVEVLVSGTAVARGTGRSKKEAEQKAARLALDEFGADGTNS